MTHKELFGALLIVTFVGCSKVADNEGGRTVDQPDGESVGIHTLEEKVKQIQIGMDRETVDDILRDICGKSGTVMLGGTGAYRRYYQIGNQQITVECDGSGRVWGIGQPAPLEEWPPGTELNMQEAGSS
ncbi:MAG: hypothetical protein ACYSWU_08140 [Planctomycetota bacterium]